MVKLPSFDTLTKRNVALRAVRRYFDEMGYCEVQTRAMRATTATDPYIESFKTFGVDEDLPLYLQTSPEYAHKILLSHVRAPIYEIARVFRRESCGLLHRSEFTLVEWYHPETDYVDMMNETEGLVRAVSAALGTQSWRSRARSELGVSIDCSSSFERLTFEEAFERYAGFSPFSQTHESLYALARQAGSRVRSEWSDNDIINCVLVDRVEPRLGIERPTFLTDYPPSMASLAQVRPRGDHRVAERFELYLCGVEICNGFSELNDAEELRSRFAEDNAERQRLGIETLPDDEALLAALPALGKLGGNAVGFDRLLMCCLGIDDIGEVTIDV